MPNHLRKKENTQITLNLGVLYEGVILTTLDLDILPSLN